MWSRNSSGSSASRRLCGSCPGFAPPGRAFSRFSFLSVEGGLDDVREFLSGRWRSSTNSINCSLLRCCKSLRSIAPWIQTSRLLARGWGGVGNCLRSTENQSVYLYVCEIKYGHHAFPLFYIPATLEYRDDSRDYVLEFDPHLLVNKQAVDWILQERQTAATNVRKSPLADRILYLGPNTSFLEAAQGVIHKLIPSFEF